MWIASRIGFFSIVKKGQPGRWQIRARRKQDLQNLLNLTCIKAEIMVPPPPADYCARISVSHKQLDTVMKWFSLTITYPNFKDEVAKNPDQRDKLGAYHEMWEVMAMYQMDGC